MGKIFDNHGSYASCTTPDGYIAERREDGIYIREVQTGQTITRYDVLCKCKPKYLGLRGIEFKLAPFQNNAHNYIAELCQACNVVSVTNRDDGVTCKGFINDQMKFSAMCAGPSGALLVWDDKNKIILQLEWNESDKQLYSVRRLKTSSGSIVQYMSYNVQENAILFGNILSVTAVYLDTGEIAWMLDRSMIENCKFQGLCCDEKGHVFLANFHSILVLCGTRGRMLSEIKMHGNLCTDVSWIQTKKQVVADMNRGYELYELGHSAISDQYVDAY